MKVAKVNHYRCDEYAAVTYVWIPDDMTQEQFKDTVDKAKVDYQTFIDKWTELKKVNHPGYGPDYKGNPDKTVAEVDAAYKEAKEKYALYEKELNKGYKTFGDYLKVYGLKKLYDNEDIFKSTIYWGHQHGKELDYEDTFSEDKNEDFPGPLKVTRF